jgi:hypothetical protein
VEASRARISQFASKLVEARRQVVHVAPSIRSCGDQIEDGWVDVMGCVGPYYPCFAVFFVLGPRGNFVQWLSMEDLGYCCILPPYYII